MERITAIFFMSLIGLITIFSLANGCMCNVEHPQASFCKASFAFVGRITNKVLVEQEGLDHIEYTFTYSPYQVFKGKHLLSRDRFNQTAYTPYYGSLCGRPDLEMGVKYFMSGTVMEDGNLLFTYCNWVHEWEEVTEMQRYYLKYSVYASNCGSCEIPGTVRFEKYDQNLHTDYSNDLQMSGYWSMRECHYNPVASIRYGSPNCEADISYCTFNEEAGMCLWKWTDSYGKCFQEREVLWQLLTGAKPAFTSLRQCRDITSPTLKNKCKKTMKKQRKLRRKQMRLEEQTAEEEMDIDLYEQGAQLELLDVDQGY